MEHIISKIVLELEENTLSGVQGFVNYAQAFMEL